MKTTILFLLSSILSLGSVPSYTEVSKDLPLITGEWPPYTSESVVGHGLHAEIVSAVIKQMGEVPAYQFLPWIRGEDDLRRGKAFASFPYRYTASRAAEFNFSDEIFFTDTVFFYNKENIDKFSFQSFEDLKAYSIGGVLGFSYVELLNKAGLKKLSWVHLDSQLIPMLGNHHVDLVAMDRVNGWLEIQKYFPNKVDQFGVLDKPVAKASDSRLMISRKYPNHESLRLRFNKALKELKANGEYDSIVNRFIHQEK